MEAGKSARLSRVPPCPGLAGAKGLAVCCAHVLLLSSCSPVLLRHADFGQEKSVSVQGLDASAVQNKIKELIKAGESMPK